MQRTGRGRPCHSNSMSWILPQWTDEKMNQKIMGDDWWEFGCITKSKLTITVKLLSKYNDQGRVAAKPTNQQTNILRDTETDKHLSRKHTKGRKIHPYKYMHKQTYCGHTHTDIHRELYKKWKMRCLMFCCYWNKYIINK